MTREEMRPDAFSVGVSGSAAGYDYVLVGGEYVVNRNTREGSMFGYYGQGAGIAMEADAGPYAALIWNLDRNRDYEGIAPAVNVDLGAGVGIQASLFWEAGTLPFSGDTWGVMVGPTGGGGFAVAGTYSDYSCLFGCQ